MRTPDERGDNLSAAGDLSRRVEIYIRLIRRGDALLARATESLLHLMKCFGADRLPASVHENVEQSPDESHVLTRSLACYTLQRVALFRRRFPQLGERADHLERAHNDLLNSLMRNATMTGTSDREILEYIRRNVPSETYGALNPLSSAQLFSALSHAGERRAHSPLGFLSFFGFVWSLRRRYPDGAAGAALEPWRPTAYVTARCLFPVKSLIEVCEERASHYDRVITIIKNLEALSGKATARETWSFAVHLDQLAGVLQTWCTSQSTRKRLKKRVIACRNCPEARPTDPTPQRCSATRSQSFAN